MIWCPIFHLHLISVFFRAAHSLPPSQIPNSAALWGASKRSKGWPCFVTHSGFDTDAGRQENDQDRYYQPINQPMKASGSKQMLINVPGTLQPMSDEERAAHAKRSVAIRIQTERDRERERETDGRTDGRTDRQTDRQPASQTGRQADRQTERQTDFFR